MASRWCYRRWVVPVVSLALGAALMAAQWIGGDFVGGLMSLGIMAVVAAIFWFGGRSETIRMMRGDGRDERWAQIDLAATALMGLVVGAALIAMTGWEVAHGRSGSPYAPLGALAGLSYLAAALTLRVRR
jgi:hypothetical protein